MTTREDLYKDFDMPFSELRKEWKRAQQAMKSDPAWSFGSERMALYHFIEERKRKYLEDKLLAIYRNSSEQTVKESYYGA